MVYVRRRGWLIWGLALIGLIAVANQWEYRLRLNREIAKSATAGLNVRYEDTLQGHRTIGIDESSLARSPARFLFFSTLMQWNYTHESKPECPKPIQKLNGAPFSSVGFMYPLESGNRIKAFCLLRSTQTCCYGPRPQYNQYILVETKAPVEMERLSPILVHGTFFIDPNPDEGYIYRMTADSVQPVEDDTPSIDAARASRQARLSLFDYAPLSGMATDRQHHTFPSALQALAGKTVVLAGYCVDRTRDALPRLYIGRSWWDGVSQGEPPTIYNSVVVSPKEALEVPPVWKPYQVFTGVLQVNTDPRQWSQEGIVQLRDATLGVPGVTPSRQDRNHPMLPWQAEVVLLGFMLFRALGLRRRADNAMPAEREPCRYVQPD